MRKLLTFIAAMLIAGNLLAGGLVTNTNQSAMFTRLQNRNASTGIDAVYYNPAGLTKLGNGFFASINNQTIGQTKTVGTNFPWIAGSPKDYVGDVSAPVYPGVYAAYNTGKLSFSLGFNPIGGGGGATYDKGLPSFEMPISALVPGLVGQGIPTTAYSADVFFEGSSVYFGYQANFAYKVNDQLSLGVGIRIVSAKNTYNGYIKNIQINPNYPAFGAKYNGSMNPAPGFFTDGSSILTQLSAGSTTAASGLTTAIAGGLPAATPLTALPAATQAQVATLLGAAGISTTGMNVGTAAATLTAVAPQYASKSAAMAAYAAATQDKEVDAEQTGTGYTPILSANFAPSDKVNISLRYEFKTNLDLTTSLIDNKGGGIFVEGKKIIADMPALLAIGAEIKPMDKLSVAASFNTYMDKKVDYDGSETDEILMIDRNFLEYGLGVEYGISEKLRASLGWVATNTGVLPAYQTDQRYSTNTNSFGAGFGYRITPKIDLNIGGQYTFYDEDVQGYSYPKPSTPLFSYDQTYNKKTWIVAVGVDFYFGKTE
ncbi:MAG: aromatic hydrocarbon degradation protein [Bacteroidetes bacterium]|nr:aromatic hydrocarbon degradation protein [Bacteroidota bacterium]